MNLAYSSALFSLRDPPGTCQEGHISVTCIVTGHPGGGDDVSDTVVG